MNVIYTFVILRKCPFFSVFIKENTHAPVSLLLGVNLSAETGEMKLLESTRLEVGLIAYLGGQGQGEGHCKGILRPFRPV